MSHFFFKLINKPLKALLIILMVLVLGAPSCEEKILERMRTVYRFDSNVKKVCVVAAWPAASSKQLSNKFHLNSVAGANKFNAGIEAYLRKYEAKSIEIISYSTLRKPPKQCNAVHQQSSVANYKKCVKAWSKATKRLGNCKNKTTKVVTIGSYFNKSDISIYVLGAQNTFAKTLKTKQGKSRSASAVKVANRIKTYVRTNK